MPQRTIDRPDRAKRAGFLQQIDGMRIEVRPGDMLEIRRASKAPGGEPEVIKQLMRVSDVSTKGIVYVRPSPGESPMDARHQMVASRLKGPMWK